MSKKEVHESLNTWSTLPEDWMVDDQGMLIPERCFINIDFIEGLFRSPTRYLYHLARKLEGKIEMQQGIRAFIPDKELRPVTEELAKKLFGKSKVKDLDFNSKILLARKLRYDYASTPKQISRMLSMDSEILSKFI